MKDKKQSKKKPNTKDVTSKTLLVVNRSGLVIFLLFVCLMLGIYKYDFLFRMQGMSLFLFDQAFFSHFFEQPGALLPCIGTFLTQFCYYPWLGALLFVVLLYLLQWSVCKAFKINNRFYLYSFIPSALLLLFITQMDYMIYIMKTPGILYSQLAGCIFTVGIFCLYRIKIPVWGRFVFLFVCVAGLYPLIGFYALLAALLAVCYELLENRNLWAYILAVYAIALILCIPWIYSSFLYLRIKISYIYIAGLPYLDFVGNNTMWYPLVLTFISFFLLLSLSYFSFKKESVSKKSMAGILTVYLLILCGVCFFTYRDANFHSLMKIEHAIEHEDWNTVLQEAKKAEYPTRSLVMYRNLALYREGKLCDEMFTYPDGSTPLAVSDTVAKFISATQISAPTVFFNFGRLNYAYRWSMELMVKNGARVDYLKLMAKVALYNHEYDLSRKYLHTLGKTLFYKDWARKYESYIDDPELFKNDPEYKSIYALLQYPDALLEENAIVESSLLNHYVHLQSGTKPMLELSMFAILTTKNIDVFWQKFSVYVAQNKDRALPLHVQEAAILFATLGGKEEVKQAIQRYVSSESAVSKRFSRFLQMVNEFNGEENDAIKSRFKKDFGNTYWYYYFFVKNIKTN